MTLAADQDRTDARRGVLQDDPLEPVRRPDSHTVPGFYAEREEPTSRVRRRVPQLAIVGAVVLPPNDEREPVGDAVGDQLRPAVPYLDESLLVQAAEKLDKQERTPAGPPGHDDRARVNLNDQWYEIAST